jgi:hypothetical protein
LINDLRILRNLHPNRSGSYDPARFNAVRHSARWGEERAKWKSGKVARFQRPVFFEVSKVQSFQVSKRKTYCIRLTKWKSCRNQPDEAAKLQTISLCQSATLLVRVPRNLETLSPSPTALPPWPPCAVACREPLARPRSCAFPVPCATDLSPGRKSAFRRGCAGSAGRSCTPALPG